MIYFDITSYNSPLSFLELPHASTHVQHHTSGNALNIVANSAHVTAMYRATSPPGRP